MLFIENNSSFNLGARVANDSEFTGGSDSDSSQILQFDLSDSLGSVLPRRTDDQLAQLEAEMLVDGRCHESIVVWEETGRLMVGYDEWPLIQKHGLDCQIARVSCADEAEARAWIWRHQTRGRGWQSKFEQIEWAIRNFKDEFVRRAEEQKGRRTDLCRDSDEGFEPIRWDVEVGKMCSPPVSKDLVSEVNACIHSSYRRLAGLGDAGQQEADDILAALRENKTTISRGRWVFDSRTRALRNDQAPDDCDPYENDAPDQYVNNILKVIDSPVEVLSQLPSDSVTAYISSYPYYCGKDYGSGVDDDDIPYDDQLALFRAMGIEQLRTLRPGGRAIINVDSMTSRSEEERRRHYKRPIVADLIRILREIGFLHYEELIWLKPNEGEKKTAWGSYMSPSCPVAIRHFESILVMTKPSDDPQNPYKLVQDSKSRGTDMSEADWDLIKKACWEIPIDTQNRGGHPCPYPEELVRRLILRYTWVNDWVVDPFVGSGTTTMVANKMGRRWTGIDKQDRWCKQALERTMSVETKEADAMLG